MAITKNLVNIGNANISNTLTAEALKKRNGTDKQILLADGTTKDMGTGTTTFLRNDGTWANPVSANTVTTTGTLTTDKLVLGAGNNKTIKTTNVGIGTGTFNATPSANTIATELGVKNYINGQLTGAMHFVGITSTTMSDNQTTNPTVSGHTIFTAGDVVIDPTDTEFIYDGSTTKKWHKLGDAKSYALADNVVNSITVKGDTWITPNHTTSQKGTVTVTLSHST